MSYDSTKPFDFKYWLKEDMEYFQQHVSEWKCKKCGKYFHCRITAKTPDCPHCGSKNPESAKVDWSPK